MSDLEALCGRCGRRVDCGDGWIHVDPAEAARAQREESGVTVCWQVHHRRCDPDPYDGGYWIDVENITSWAGLAHWTAHLMAKRWLEATDWDELLREAAGEIPPVRLRPVALESAA